MPGVERNFVVYFLNSLTWVSPSFLKEQRETETIDSGADFLPAHIQGAVNIQQALP